MSAIRFAPSPTGAFHLGNFRTAWIAGETARRLGRGLVVRFEDIDAPRVVAGAADRQLRELRELGLNPERVEHQSAHHARHAALFERAVREGSVYLCTCSRKEVQAAIAGLASAPHAEPAVYNGHCRPKEPGAPSSFGTVPAGASSVGWRFRSPQEDGSQDFLIARSADPSGRDFVPAYHWACAIDDFDGGYALLVRAWDLEGAASQQRAIHRLLERWEGERAVPAVFHTALVTSDDDHRLEKRTPGVTWPELLGRTGGVQELIELLSRSFEAEWPRDGAGLQRWVEPGALCGESRRTLRLSQFFGARAR